MRERNTRADPGTRVKITTRQEDDTRMRTVNIHKTASPNYALLETWTHKVRICNFDIRGKQ